MYRLFSNCSFKLKVRADDYLKMLTDHMKRTHTNILFKFIKKPYFKSIKRTRYHHHYQYFITYIYNKIFTYYFYYCTLYNKPFFIISIIKTLLSASS